MSMQADKVRKVLQMAAPSDKMASKPSLVWLDIITVSFVPLQM